MGYSKAPEQPQSSARPMCHSHTMTRTGREPATVPHCCIGAHRATHCATGDDNIQVCFDLINCTIISDFANPVNSFMGRSNYLNLPLHLASL